jgi:cyanophycinase
MGGSQLRLLESLKKQGLDEDIRNAHKRGVFVAGNSAGAAVLVTVAVVGGMEKGNRFIRKDNIKFAAALGLVSNMVIDTHIDYLERYMRLFGEAALTEALLVAGLEEDTGLLLKGCRAKVLGKGSLVIVRRGADFRTNVYGDLGRARSADVENLIVSVFAPGAEFDLHSLYPDRDI